MAQILISWGQDKPHAALVALMISKAEAYHVISKPELHYGPRWPNEDGTHADYDQPCWHIRDLGCRAPASSSGVEGCQGLLEGLQAGWELRGKTKVR